MRRKKRDEKYKILTDDILNTLCDDLGIRSLDERVKLIKSLKQGFSVMPYMASGEFNFVGWSLGQVLTTSMTIDWETPIQYKYVRGRTYISMQQRKLYLSRVYSMFNMILPLVINPKEYIEEYSEKIQYSDDVETKTKKFLVSMLNSFKVTNTQMQMVEKFAMSIMDNDDFLKYKLQNYSPDITANEMFRICYIYTILTNNDNREAVKNFLVNRIAKNSNFTLRSLRELVNTYSHIILRQAMRHSSRLSIFNCYHANMVTLTQKELKIIFALLLYNMDDTVIKCRQCFSILKEDEVSYCSVRLSDVCPNCFSDNLTYHSYRSDKFYAGTTAIVRYMTANIFFDNILPTFKQFFKEDIVSLYTLKKHLTFQLRNKEQNRT